jgi:hypothetical protein
MQGVQRHIHCFSFMFLLIEIDTVYPQGKVLGRDVPRVSDSMADQYQVTALR